MPDPEQPQRLAKQPRDIPRSVILHHPLNLDAASSEPAQSSDQEGSGRAASLVRQHLYVGQAGGIIDGDMKAIISTTSAGVAPVTRDAMAHRLEAKQLGLVITAYLAENDLPFAANRAHNFRMMCGD